MNIPNKLTVLRLVMVPLFFIGFLIRGAGGTTLLIGGTIVMVVSYIVAELSDLLDGQIARRRKMVTDLGKVLDPFADTLSHLTYFVCFTSSTVVLASGKAVSLMPVWAFIVIMWREFGILFVRMLLMRKGKAMPANWFGKTKTVFYAVTSILSIAFLTCDALLAPGRWVDISYWVIYGFFALSAFMSLMSFIIYLKDVFKSKILSDMTR